MVAITGMENFTSSTKEIRVQQIFLLNTIPLPISMIFMLICSLLCGVCYVQHKKMYPEPLNCLNKEILI